MEERTADCRKTSITDVTHGNSSMRRHWGITGQDNTMRRSIEVTIRHDILMTGTRIAVGVSIRAGLITGTRIAAGVGIRAGLTTGTRIAAVVIIRTGLTTGTRIALICVIRTRQRRSIRREVTPSTR
jgi:hypothetical protein